MAAKDGRRHLSTFHLINEHEMIMMMMMIKEVAMENVILLLTSCAVRKLYHRHIS